jgi:hypothetical protein
LYGGGNRAAAAKGLQKGSLHNPGRSNSMKFKIIAAALITVGAASAAHAAVVPCEDALKDLRTQMESAKLNDADMKAVKELEAKGVERCNADDDKRADDFFGDAMKIVGKK